MTSYAVEMHREDVSNPESMRPFGSRVELRSSLERFNTWAETDGAEETELYGPGIYVSLPPHDADAPDAPIYNFQISEDDDTISRAVLARLAKNFDWDLIDMSTGRRLHLYRPPEDDDVDSEES